MVLYKAWLYGPDKCEWSNYPELYPSELVIKVKPNDYGNVDWDEQESINEVGQFFSNHKLKLWDIRIKL